MSVIIEGYNYDIFISYRQKDNKHDGWVTNFVENLKGQLEATFKEDVTVYFDENPHDGLLETHDVDESLKEKLKCLVFIPVISRTYCDPKSFAWEHEFKAFIEQASHDQFGLKVKLPNGNVAGRVLPVRIHDLDPADIKECETVLGGVLRGVEFIYKESGIDKPLTADDDEKKNLNNTKYRIQIIKVTHAIKEIIQGIKDASFNVMKENKVHREPLEEVKKKGYAEVYDKSVKLSNIRLLSIVFTTVILIIAAIFAFPKLFQKDTLKSLREKGKISIAVMPFQNMTNDTTWNIWQDGIQDNVINYLSNFTDELTVRQTESINDFIKSRGITNYATITPILAKTISQNLNADIFISGSLQHAATKLRVNARLIDTKTEEVLKSFEIDGLYNDSIIFKITDSLRKRITNFLIISVLEKKLPQELRPPVSTYSWEAYRYYMYGNRHFYKLDYPTAREWLMKAIDIDSNFINPLKLLIYSYTNQGLYEEGRKWMLRLNKKSDQMTLREKIETNILYAQYFETPYERIKYLKQLLAIDDQIPIPYHLIGNAYNDLFLYENAIHEFETQLEIYKKLNSKPRFVLCYTNLGFAYHQLGLFKKERMLYKKAERDFPNDPLLIRRQAILSLTEGKTKSANEYIEEIETIQRNDMISETDIALNLARIYAEAEILHKAEEYYRQALSLGSDNPIGMNALAYLLIDKDRNINEGMELIETALILSPDNFNYLHTKGWGLYKQGKYQDALDILQKSWDLRMGNAIYNHTAWLHLEAAKKAVAGQKN